MELGIGDELVCATRPQVCLSMSQPIFGFICVHVNFVSDHSFGLAWFGNLLERKIIRQLS